MLCKIARNCLGFVLKLERSAKPLRPSQFKSQKHVADMTSGVKPAHKHDRSRDHLVRTEGTFRQDKKLIATVIDIEKLSPTVRGLKLLISDAPTGITFKAGQWVDMMIPGVKTVGGFSICSSPSEFESRGILEFAVKYADHPPAKWIHQQCHIGSTLAIKFGGNFFYDPTLHDKKDLLLIAGGVGIVPIYSILRQRLSLSTNNHSAPVSTKLVYSARTLEEMLFREDIQKICNGITNTSFDSFITHESESPVTYRGNGLHHGRINRKSLQEALITFQKNPTCFICGPPNFIDTIVEHLANLGMSLNDINYEKWW